MTIDEKYLINPFIKEVKSKSFINRKYTMNIIQGTTGLGKTYATYNTFVPYCFEQGLDLVIYSYPLTEIYDSVGAMSVVSKSNGVVHCTDVYQAMEALSNGFKVFFTSTHQYLLDINGRKLFDYVENKGVTLGWFVDEPHTWTISSKENYKDVLGSFSIKYNNRLYSLLERMSTKTPYIFGTTATPHAEQTLKVPVNGMLSYEIINERPDLYEMISRTGWMGSVTPYELGNAEQPNGFETVSTLGDALRTHHFKSDTYGKRTMLITAEMSNGANGWNVEYVKELLKDFYTSIHPELHLENQVAILTSDFKGYINFVKQGFGYKFEDHSCEESQILSDLSNPNENAQILIVIEKAKMGMNVHNLKTYFSFRKTDKERSGEYDHEPITETPLQIVGRLMRIWTGIPNRDFVNKWGYDLTDYIKSLSDGECKNLLECNSYDIYHPNNTMWAEAVNILKTELSPTKDSALAWMNKLRK